MSIYFLCIWCICVQLIFQARSSYLHCTRLFSQCDGLRRQKQMAVPTMQAEMISRLLTATKTNHVNSKPSSVPLSWPENFTFKMSIFEINGTRASPILTTTQCVRQFIGSVAAMIDIITYQIGMNAQFIWGAAKLLACMLCTIIIIDIEYFWKSHSANDHLLEFLTAVIINLKPLESVPQPSVTYFSVTKFVCVMRAPTDCLVLRHDKSVWKNRIFSKNSLIRGHQYATLFNPYFN